MALAFNLALLFFIIQCVFTKVSTDLYRKSGKGMSPDSRETNMLIILVLFALLYCLWNISPLFSTIATPLALILCIRYFLHLGKHFKAFLQHTSNVRRARTIYETTGEKTDRSIVGYTSLNTLMLSALVGIFGFFCLGAIAYQSWNWVPDVAVHSGY